MKSEDKQRKEISAYLERFDQLPDTAVVPTRVTKAILPMSERTIRYHPDLPRRYISKKLYGQSVGDIRRVARRLIAVSR